MPLHDPHCLSKLRRLFCRCISPIADNQKNMRPNVARRMNNQMIRKLIFSLPGLAWAGAASADLTLNMPRGVTQLSEETYEIHMLAFWWCVAIGVIVFGAMIYSLFAHRKSRGAKSADFSHSTAAEVIWTTIPCFILLFMAVPAAETMIKLEDSRNPDLSVVVTGYQWRWHYQYQDQGIEFYSSLAQSSLEARRLNSGISPYDVENYLLEVDNPLVVPVGAKVRILLTSNDVLHAWWVPELAIKKDAIPGIVNETWFKPDIAGTYRGQCAELCGKDHGYMPVVVEVLEPDAYASWVAAQTADNNDNNGSSE
jgi:cytochrome c oxidase subunit 2